MAGTELSWPECHQKSSWFGRGFLTKFDSGMRSRECTESTRVAEQETLGFQEAIPLARALMFGWTEAVALKDLEIVGTSVAVYRTRTRIAAIRRLNIRPL